MATKNSESLEEGKRFRGCPEAQTRRNHLNLECCNKLGRRKCGKIIHVDIEVFDRWICTILELSTVSCGYKLRYLMLTSSFFLSNLLIDDEAGCVLQFHFRNAILNLIVRKTVGYDAREVRTSKIPKLQMNRETNSMQEVHETEILREGHARGRRLLRETKVNVSAKNPT